MEDQKKCPLCNAEIPEGAREVPFIQLLVKPILTLQAQLDQQEVLALKLHEQGAYDAESAVLEQIRHHCDSLCALVRCALN